MTLLAAICFAAAQIDLAGDWRLSGTDEKGAAASVSAELRSFLELLRRHRARRVVLIATSL